MLGPAGLQERRLLLYGRRHCLDQVYGQDPDPQPEGLGDPKGKWGGGWVLGSQQKNTAIPPSGLVHAPSPHNCRAMFPGHPHTQSTKLRWRLRTRGSTGLSDKTLLPLDLSAPSVPGSVLGTRDRTEHKWMMIPPSVVGGFFLRRFSCLSAGRGLGLEFK